MLYSIPEGVMKIWTKHNDKMKEPYSINVLNIAVDNKEITNLKSISNVLF